MSKRAILVLLVFVAVFAVPLFVSFAEGLFNHQEKWNVYVDYQWVTDHQYPIQIDNQMMIPVEWVETFHVTHEYEQSTRKLILTQEKSKLELSLDEIKANWNGQTIELNQAPIQKEDTFYVPLQSISSQFGISYFYDLKTCVMYLRTVSTVSDWDGKFPLPSAVPALLPHEQIASLSKIEISEKGLEVVANTGMVQPIIEKSKNPAVFIVDFPKTVLGKELFPLIQEGIGKQIVSHPFVKQITFYDVMPLHQVRVIIELTEPMRYEIQSMKNATTFEMAIVEPRYVVVIDPGHGGKDPGNIAYSGKYEKEFTLSLSKKIKSALSAYPRIDVLLTREDDTFVKLEERAEFANRNHADLFLSIHGNNFEDASASGTETYYTYSDSLSFANRIHSAAISATGFRDRNVRYNDYKVTRLTSMPAVLLEVGYQTNPQEEIAMNRPDVQTNLAQAIAQVIASYLAEHEGEPLEKR